MLWCAQSERSSLGSLGTSRITMPFIYRASSERLVLDYATQRHIFPRVCVNVCVLRLNIK